ncbi:MAG: RNA polymerase factor sigma-54 [Wenzhouxiangellaceae bacterium]|nr:RNA polymerase factor sigma-54 [Wenzhouxiangellaceae bacterium]
MVLSPGIKLKLGQQLKLAPQLRQAIALLQLNRLELREHLEQAVEANPLLELDAPVETAADGESDRGESDTETREADRSADDIDFDGEDYSWDDLPDGFSEVSEAPDYDRFIADPHQQTLTEHLLWQVNLAGFSDTDEAIARAIVYTLDEDGFLSADLGDIRISLAPEYLVGLDEIEAVLQRLQHFEPVGIAARSLAECLRLQLDALPSGTPGRGLARELLAHHLDALASPDLDRLAGRTGYTRAEVETALAVIRHLNPRPGLRFVSDERDYIVPDAFVHPDDENGWRVTLNRAQQPSLTINRAYRELIRTTRGEDRDYLREQLKQAQWLISSLELRNQTLSSVVLGLVRHQAAFFEHGEIALKPLLQKELAEAIGVHESTVSRATGGKYLHTPRGTFEFKHFFSVAIPTGDGGEVAATAVRARIERLIHDEPPGQPLSDQALTDALAGQGVLLARRTVAKYREQLGIPNSSRRRRLARNERASG